MLPGNLASLCKNIVKCIIAIVTNILGLDLPSQEGYDDKKFNLNLQIPFLMQLYVIILVRNMKL